MPDVIMPRLSDSMEEGTILRWLKADGDEVARDEELLEIETDKATMTYESDAAGVLSIAVGEGETVPVGAVIGRLGDGSGADGAAGSASAAGAAAGAARAAAAAAPAAPAAGAAPASAAPASAAPARAAGRVNASPVARRTAQRLGVELSAVTGTGPHGRILKADVVAAAEGGAAGAAARAVPASAADGPVPGAAAPTAAPTAARPAAPAPADAGAATVEELSRTQALIARRMAESRSTVPDFSVQVDVDMGAALELRARLKELSDAPPSLNDLVVKAAAVTLRRHPRANGSYRDGRFELHEQVNVGVAVAADDALVVPTVRDADRKSLGAIAAETRRLIARVRDRKITPPDLSGGTFTVSNLGMFGVDRFEGIINPPQAAILCAGAIRDRAWVVDGRIEPRPIMTLTLACDHRILYGADAARFLADLRALLEEPLGLAL